MRYDMVKVEEAVLALLGVFEFDNGRVWKRYDFATMDGLHEKGLITVSPRQAGVGLPDGRRDAPCQGARGQIFRNQRGGAGAPIAAAESGQDRSVDNDSEFERRRSQC